GRRIAFVSLRTGSADIYVRSAEPGGIDEPFIASPQLKSTGGWSPDGDYFVFGEITPLGRAGIYAIRLRDDDRQPFPVHAGAERPQPKAFAGRSLAGVRIGRDRVRATGTLHSAVSGRRRATQTGVGDRGCDGSLEPRQPVALLRFSRRRAHNGQCPGWPAE